MLGLPRAVRACLFDLDGVLTDTARVHTAAWKTMFDAFLLPRGEREFTAADYATFVDGKPRADGTRDLLRSRGIDLPEDAPDGQDSVRALGERKNDLVLRLVEEQGVEVFPASVDYLRAVRAAGLGTAVVSSSANTEAVLQVVGIADLFDVRVDGVVAQERGLPGKPAPDTFLFAAEQLGVGTDAAVFEDALSGVQAGRAGGFALVVGVDRAGQAEALRAAGADVVVRELSELR